MLSSRRPGHIWITKKEKRPTEPGIPELADPAATHTKRSLLLKEQGRKEKRTDPEKDENREDPRGVSQNTFRSRLPASASWRSVPARISKMAASSALDQLMPSPGWTRASIVSTIGAMVI